MSKAKRSSPPVAQRPSADLSLERIAKVLSLLLIRGTGTSESIKSLHQIGYSNQEVAEMLKTTTGNVAQTLYASRKPPKKRLKQKAE